MASGGKTAVAVVTSEFEALAHTMAANAGRSGLRVHVLPYPLDSLPEDDVRKIADGRVLTGQQAQELGLIDELGNFNDAVDTAREKAGLSGEPRLIYPPEERSKLLEGLLGSAAKAVGDAVRAGIHEEASAAHAPGLYFLAR